MTTVLLRTFPDPILRKKTQAVMAFDRSLLKLVAALVRVMKSQPHGIGIAAPQIGVAKAVAIVVGAALPTAGRFCGFTLRKCAFQRGAWELIWK